MVTIFRPAFPKLRGEGNTLRVSLPLGARLRTLLSFDRRVEIDGLRRGIVVEERRLWLRHSRKEFRFDRVKNIAHDFESRVGHRGCHRIETYTVGVELRDPDEMVVLAEFVGCAREGGFGTALLWGGVSGQGRQAEASRELVDRLQDILGVPVGHEKRRSAALEETPYRCAECERPSPPGRETCQYCGGRVEQV